MKWIPKRYRVVLIFALIMCAIQLVNWATHYSLTPLGVLPRSIRGIFGIITSAWIHLSWQHLFSNLPVFIILSVLIVSQSLGYYLWASLIIIVSEGVFVWLFARSAYHVGASGWIFGLWAVLLINGIVRRRFVDVVLSILVFIYYGSMVTGLLPLQSGVSFEGHIGGAIGGIIAAMLLRKKSL